MRAMRTLLIWRCRCGSALTACVCAQFRLLTPVNIKSWAVVVLRNERDLVGDGAGGLKNFNSTVVKGFTAMGIGMPRDPDRVEWVGDMGRYPEQGKLHQAVNNVLNVLRPKGKTPDLMFFIIPKRGVLLTSPQCH